MNRRRAAALCLLLALAASAATSAVAQDGGASDEVPAATQLIEKLASEDVGERQKAAYALYKLGAAAAPAVLPLATAVGDADAYVRDVAARTLAKIPMSAEVAAPAVAELLTSDRKEVRREAATLLFRLGPHSFRAVKQLTDALGSEDSVVRANAAATLGKCGSNANPAREQLEAALEDEDESVRTQVAGAIATLDPVGSFAHANAAVRKAAAMGQTPFGPKSDAVLDALLRALDDEDRDVRMWSANAISTAFISVDEDRRAAALPRLKEALAEDEFEQARTSIAWALGRYTKTPDAVIPALVAAAKNDDAKSVRQACIQALGWIGAASRDEVFPVLLNGMADEDPLMRQMAVTSFLWSKDCSERVLRVLRGGLADPDGNVRGSTAGAIGARQAAAGALVPALIACYGKHADRRTRAAVVNALAVMGEPARAAVPMLEKTLATDPTDTTVAYALCMLHAPEEHAALDALIEAARSDDKRFLALQYFARIGEGAKRAVPVMVELLEGDRPAVCIEAAAYLGQMGPPAAAAIPALEKAAAGDDADLVKVARESLAKIRAEPSDEKR